MKTADSNIHIPTTKHSHVKIKGLSSFKTFFAKLEHLKKMSLVPLRAQNTSEIKQFEEITKYRKRIFHNTNKAWAKPATKTAVTLISDKNDTEHKISSRAAKLGYASVQLEGLQGCNSIQGKETNFVQRKREKRLSKTRENGCINGEKSKEPCEETDKEKAATSQRTASSKTTSHNKTSTDHKAAKTADEKDGTAKPKSKRADSPPSNKKGTNKAELATAANKLQAKMPGKSHAKEIHGSKNTNDPSDWKRTTSNSASDFRDDIITQIRREPCRDHESNIVLYNVKCEDNYQVEDLQTIPKEQIFGTSVMPKEMIFNCKSTAEPAESSVTTSPCNVQAKSADSWNTETSLDEKQPEASVSPLNKHQNVAQEASSEYANRKSRNSKYEQNLPTRDVKENSKYAKDTKNTSESEPQTDNPLTKAGNLSENCSEFATFRSRNSPTQHCTKPETEFTSNSLPQQSDKTSHLIPDSLVKDIAKPRTSIENEINRAVIANSNTNKRKSAASSRSTPINESGPRLLPECFPFDGFTANDRDHLSSSEGEYRSLFNGKPAAMSLSDNIEQEETQKKWQDSQSFCENHTDSYEPGMHKHKLHQELFEANYKLSILNGRPSPPDLNLEMESSSVQKKNTITSDNRLFSSLETDFSEYEKLLRAQRQKKHKPSMAFSRGRFGQSILFSDSDDTDDSSAEIYRRKIRKIETSLDVWNQAINKLTTNSKNSLSMYEKFEKRTSVCRSQFESTSKHTFRHIKSRYPNEGFKSKHSNLTEQNLLQSLNQQGSSVWKADVTSWLEELDNNKLSDIFVLFSNDSYLEIQKTPFTILQHANQSLKNLLTGPLDIQPLEISDWNDKKEIAIYMATPVECLEIAMGNTKKIHLFKENKMPHKMKACIRVSILGQEEVERLMPCLKMNAKYKTLEKITDLNENIRILFLFICGSSFFDQSNKCAAIENDSQAEAPQRVWYTINLNEIESIGEGFLRIGCMKSLKSKPTKKDEYNKELKTSLLKEIQDNLDKGEALFEESLVNLRNSYTFKEQKKKSFEYGWSSSTELLCPSIGWHNDHRRMESALKKRMIFKNPSHGSCCNSDGIQSSFPETDTSLGPTFYSDGTLINDAIFDNDLIDEIEAVIQSTSIETPQKTDHKSSPGKDDSHEDDQIKMSALSRTSSRSTLIHSGAAD